MNLRLRNASEDAKITHTISIVFQF